MAPGAPTGSAADLGREAVAELKAHGQPLVLLVPEDVRREDQERDESAEVRPARAQRARVAEDDGQEQHRSDQDHGVFPEQTETDRCTGGEPTSTLAGKRALALVQGQRPGQAQHRVGRGDDAAGESGNGREDQDQRQGEIARRREAAVAEEACKDEQRQCAGDQCPRACGERRPRGEPGADTEQRHTRWMIEIAPGEAAGPVEVIGLVLRDGQDRGDAQPPGGHGRDQCEQEAPRLTGCIDASGRFHGLVTRWVV